MNAASPPGWVRSINERLYKSGFGRLWAAYAVSTFGTRLAFDALPLIAILALDAGPAHVSVLAAAGPAAGALLALPVGPWVEFRRKRPVMVAMDAVRGAAVLSVPAAFALGRLTFPQLLLVAVVVAVADIAFRAASGACLKAMVAPGDLLAANARLESTNWTATALGPPLGGAAVGMLGPMATVLVDAASYALSALGIRTIRGRDEPPARSNPAARELLAGWRCIAGDPILRRLLLNSVLFNGLVLATAPLMAVLMLGELRFAPWKYGLAFGAPCLGGLAGALLSRRAVARHGRARVLRGAGALRACWSLGLACVVPGPAGLALVIAVQVGLVTSVGVFNPVFATTRLDRTPPDRVARTLAAWSLVNGLVVAALIALWGVLGALAGPRAAIAAAGILLLATPLLLPRG